MTPWPSDWSLIEINDLVYLTNLWSFILDQPFQLYKVKSSKVGNCRNWSQRIPMFRAKALRQQKKRVLKRLLLSSYNLTVPRGPAWANSHQPNVTTGRNRFTREKTAVNSWVKEDNIFLTRVQVTLSRQPRRAGIELYCHRAERHVLYHCTSNTHL